MTREELLDFYNGRIAKWWTPDDVAFVDSIPLGATGKMLKNKLREQFAAALPASLRSSIRSLKSGLVSGKLFPRINSHK